ncbi:hypothetical protein HG531_012502 [Fusarium graminearum]|nr:hypothetical protein HG531_012502 [Fusarium graminearum]
MSAIDYLFFDQKPALASVMPFGPQTVLVGMVIPLEVRVGVVRLKALIKHTKTLSVLGNLVPVTTNVLEILAKVGKAALEDLAVQIRAHDGFEINVLGPCLVRLGEDKVGCLFDGAEERADFFGVLGQEGLVSDVEDGAEAAATKLGKFIDAQHLDIILGTTLSSEPLLELNHLDILQADTGVNLAFDDGLGDIHTAAHSGVVLGGHAVVRGEFVNLDLAKLADIADALTLEGAEVGGDARVLEVDDSREGLVEKTADGLDREVSSLGSQSVNHGLETKVDLASSDNLSDILPSQHLCCHQLPEKHLH